MFVICGNRVRSAKPLMLNNMRHLQLSRKTVNPKKTKGYLALKGKNIIENYEKKLQRNFPRTFNLYSALSLGVKSLYSDLMLSYRLHSQLKNNGESTLSYRLHSQLKNNGESTFERKDLETYYQTKKDLKKTTFILTMVALPFANYAFIPLAYLFPKILTHQFWNIEQKVTFRFMDHVTKAEYYFPVLIHLRNSYPLFSDDQLKHSFDEMLKGLGEKNDLSEKNKDILHFKPLFTHNIYSIENLTRVHQRCLCRINGISPFFIGRRRRLIKYASLLQTMDQALVSEGVETLTLPDLYTCCFIRGYNPHSCSKEHLVNFLKRWISISEDIQASNIHDIYQHKIKKCDGLSLLLHCPAFLSNSLKNPTTMEEPK